MANVASDMGFGQELPTPVFLSSLFRERPLEMAQNLPLLLHANNHMV